MTTEEIDEIIWAMTRHVVRSQENQEHGYSHGLGVLQSYLLWAVQRLPEKYHQEFKEYAQRTIERYPIKEDA